MDGRLNSAFVRIVRETKCFVFYRKYNSRKIQKKPEKDILKPETLDNIGYYYVYFYNELVDDVFKMKKKDFYEDFKVRDMNSVFHKKFHYYMNIELKNYEEEYFENTNFRNLCIFTEYYLRQYRYEDINIRKEIVDIYKYLNEEHKKYYNEWIDVEVCHNGLIYEGSDYREQYKRYTEKFEELKKHFDKCIESNMELEKKNVEIREINYEIETIKIFNDNFDEMYSSPMENEKRFKLEKLKEYNNKKLEKLNKRLEELN